MIEKKFTQLLQIIEMKIFLQKVFENEVKEEFIYVKLTEGFL